MIDIIRQILQESKFNAIESDRKMTLFQGNPSDNPEDYIEMEKVMNRYIISEVHRDNKQIKVETENKDEAIIYTVIIYKRLYDNIVDRMAARKIRDCLKLGEEDIVIEYIHSKFASSIYSIGREDVLKISLIKWEDCVDVKYGGEYLAEKATLSRGYVVLNNYCEKFKYISRFYDEIKTKIECTIEREKIQKLYILGI